MMKKSYLACAFVVTVYGSPAATAVEDYKDGIVIVNESQYGKGSGTLNFLQPGKETDFWQYRVFREVNPGRELGCTHATEGIMMGTVCRFQARQRPCVIGCRRNIDCDGRCHIAMGRTD